MNNIGIIGLGDMGGTLVEDTVELGRRVDAAFVLVMNWD